MALNFGCLLAISECGYISSCTLRSAVLPFSDRTAIFRAISHRCGNELLLKSFEEKRNLREKPKRKPIKNWVETEKCLCAIRLHSNRIVMKMYVVRLLNRLWCSISKPQQWFRYPISCFLVAFVPGRRGFCEIGCCAISERRPNSQYSV